jgi:hypothetical protein
VILIEVMKTKKPKNNKQRSEKLVLELTAEVTAEEELTAEEMQAVSGARESQNKDW